MPAPPEHEIGVSGNDDPTPTLAGPLGASTATYSLALIASPRLLATPCKLTTTAGTVTSHVATLIRVIAVRDTASGLAMALAPTGPALRGAVADRAASDFGDAAIFGAALPDVPTKAKIAGFAAEWGLLCAYSGRHTG
nr:hypothetical protein [Rhodococcus wratislaviensis]